MAIIGNIFKLEAFLKDRNINIVFDYFKQALEKNSAIHKRIFNLPVRAFEKVNITDNIIALEQVFFTKNRKECIIESHKKYIDFQLVLYGAEEMEYIDIDKLEINTPYNKSTDLITYKMVSNTSKFVMQEADLAIFFPDDAHIGQPKHKKTELVYKTVIKLPIALWKNR